MLTISDINTSLTEPTAVALGTFDGVHLGHREVIGAAVRAAGKEGLLSAVFTFPTLPKNAFLPEDGRIAPLISFREKAALMEGLGVDVLFAPEFSKELRSLAPEEFIEEIIIGRLCAAHIVCGEDHRFGAGGAGDTALLERICRERSVALTVVPPVTFGGVRVSSTLIRELIARGNAAEARALLGKDR